MRSLNRSPGWRPGPLLSRVRRPGGRLRGRNRGRAGGRPRGPTPDPDRVPAGARTPVRLLYTRHPDDCGGVSGRAPDSESRRSARGDLRASVPLHGLSEDRRGGGAGGRAAGSIRGGRCPPVDARHCLREPSSERGDAMILPPTRLRPVSTPGDEAGLPAEGPYMATPCLTSCSGRTCLVTMWYPS